MTTEDTFVEVILANRDELEPRLVYADWLEERGDPRGRYLRLECEFVRRLVRPTRGLLQQDLTIQLGQLAREVDQEWIKFVGSRFDLRLETTGDHRLWVARCLIVTLMEPQDRALRIARLAPTTIADLDWPRVFELKKYIDLAGTHANPPRCYLQRNMNRPNLFQQKSTAN